ncbi:cyclic nucleotide-binding domain-containing protein [Tundrisphaera sp. TA3]|uniref:cyclic nucleotide-binding domain-containing protein n=1 Tax=Tundrisphaera sp. TA3 TaxID=3435775 RepID=UPI003EBF9252
MSQGPVMVSVTIDGKGVEVPAGTTIYDAAQKLGISIPILCHREHMTPAGVCRVCAVDVGERVLAPACYRQITPDMAGRKITTSVPPGKAQDSVKTLVELLMADHPSPCAKHREHGDCELEVMAERFAVHGSRFARAEARPRDDSSVVIAVDHSACILCDRCIRGCNEIRHNEVIGRTGKGFLARIAFDLDDPMGNSTCVSCGECMVSCPTGALTNRAVVNRVLTIPVADEVGDIGPVPSEELVRLPLFEGISHAFLRFNENAVVRRAYRPGEVICREGEYGSTAFFIEKGRVKIFIKTGFNHTKTDAGSPTRRERPGLFGRLTTRFVGRKEDHREGEGDERYIPVDAPVSLRYDNPVDTLHAGDIFGEMTCMNSYPRSATCTAEGDLVVLEMDRNVLSILQRGKKSKALLDERYRQRSIDNHLRSVPIFSTVARDPAAFIRLVDLLREQVTLERFNNGETIFRQGDPADAFFLIRTGFVKVARSNMGSEHVLSYLGPGNYFGEIGLLAELPEVRAMGIENARRTATCSALDHVDLVRISADAFQEVLDQFPEVRRQVVEIAGRRLRATEATLREVEKIPLGEFLNQGLMNAQSLLVLDLEKCTRCDECTKACADTHDGVTRLIREGLRFDKFLVASSCRSCMDPYCMVGCPVNSIKRLDSREIIIEDHCIGCGKCAENCPYGNINMHSLPEALEDDPSAPGQKIAVVRQKATMCDLCRDVDGQPSCVYACPHDAAHRMTGRELLDNVRTSRALRIGLP